VFPLVHVKHEKHSHKATNEIKHAHGRRRAAVDGRASHLAVYRHAPKASMIHLGVNTCLDPISAVWCCSRSI
jgi:hypothetical protein